MNAKTIKIGNKIPPRMWWACGGAGATFTSLLSSGSSGFFVDVVVGAAVVSGFADDVLTAGLFVDGTVTTGAFVVDSVG